VFGGRRLQTQGHVTALGYDLNVLSEFTSTKWRYQSVGAAQVFGKFSPD